MNKNFIFIPILGILFIFVAFNFGGWSNNWKQRILNYNQVFSPCSFQKGVLPFQGYSGVKDCYLDGDNQSTNYGDGNLLLADTTSPGSSGDKVILIQFDVSRLQSNFTIDNVELELTVLNVPGATNQRIYECLRPFDEHQATFDEYSSGNSWTNEGCRGNTTDMDGVFGQASGSVSEYNLAGSETDGDIIKFPSSESFKTLVQNAINGDGILRLVIHENFTDDFEVSYYSSESSTKQYRPKLLIVWS